RRWAGHRRDGGAGRPRGRAGGGDQAGAQGRAAPHRRAELLHTPRAAGRQGRRRDHPAHQQAGGLLRARDPHPGLAHAGPYLLRLDPFRQEALRGHQAALRRSGAVARSLRAGHTGRGAPPGAEDPARGAHHPQGLPPRDRLLLGLPRGGREDPDRPGRLSQGAQPHRLLLRGPRYRLLRGMVGARRAQGGLQRLRHRGRLPRHRRAGLARQGLDGHAGGGREADAVQRHRDHVTIACEKRPAVASRGMVVANHPLGAAGGAEMLAAGGNAVDAAIASLFALTVVEPMMVGIFGAGMTHLRLADGRHTAIDNYSVAPAAGNPEMYRPMSDAWPDYLRAEDDVNSVGVLSVGVPGTLRGWCEVLERFGTLPLDAVTEPAIRHGARGVGATASLVEAIPEAAPDLARFPASARTFLPGGAPPKPGQLITQADYAETLRVISAK